MAWRLAGSLVTLRSQVNERWPTRDTHSDGTIGDAAHAATASDHNPNAQGVVCAFDLDVDLDGVDDSFDSTGSLHAVINSIIGSRDSRVAFIILDHRIVRSYDKPGVAAWTWDAYHGADPHTSHAHISVGQGPEGNRIGNYDDPSPWVINEGDDMLDSNDPLVQRLLAAAENTAWGVLDPAQGLRKMVADLAGKPVAAIDAKAIADAIPKDIAQQVADALVERLKS